MLIIYNLLSGGLFVALILLMHGQRYCLVHTAPSPPPSTLEETALLYQFGFGFVNNLLTSELLGKAEWFYKNPVEGD